MFFTSESKKILSVVLVVTIITSFSLIPQRAEAGYSGLAGCAASLIAGVVASLTDVPVNDVSGNIKEQCMDALFYVLNEIVIKEITKTTVDWINSGFNGNPAYVTDLDKFAEDIADQVFGQFIESSELNFLCSPFKLEIKKALILSNQRSRDGRSAFGNQVTCRLSDVTKNIDNFIGGDFADGGWDAWRVLTEDNAYSQYITVSAELRARTNSAIANEEKKLEFGRGFLSYEKCDDGTSGNPATNNSGTTSSVPPQQGPNPDGSTVDANPPPNCEIVTPGSVIEDQLNNTLGTGQRRLEMADEFNEIVDALLAYLVTEALTEGLRSLSDDDDSSGKTYTESLQESNTPAGEGAVEIIESSSINPTNFEESSNSDSTTNTNPSSEEISPDQLQQLFDQYQSAVSTTTQ